MQSASYIYSRCPDYLSSDCVTYVGPSIPCLNICTNQTVTQVESAIANSLCTLIGETDMSAIQIPQCLLTLWGTAEPTIKTLFALLLEDACNQQASISSLQNQISTIDPLVTIDYKCCSANPCVTTGTVKLSVDLQNLVNCLCDLNSQIETIKADINELNQSIISNSNAITYLSNTQTTIQNITTTTASGLQSLTNTVNCIKSALIAQGINVSNC